MVGFCETVSSPQEKSKAWLWVPDQLLVLPFLLLLFRSSSRELGVVVHESAEKLKGGTKAKRRIFQENFLEEVALSYDAKQE